MIGNEDRNEASGLCMTCNHANFCIYLVSASSPIWCCEEFDDRPPVIKPKMNVQVEQSIPIREQKSVIGENLEHQLRKAS